jgi:hypothetical protein
MACPALAQEGAAAAGAEAPSAAGSAPGDGVATKGEPDGAAAANHGVDLVAPRSRATGLWRRANEKTSIANASAGLLAASTHMGPPSRPRIDVSAQRNALGIAIPGALSPGHGVSGVTTATRSTGIATTAGSVGNTTMQVHAPASTGPVLRGAAINGTVMSRIAAAPVSIGGPAKDRSGINGTLMRSRH